MRTSKLSFDNIKVFKSKNYEIKRVVSRLSTPSNKFDSVQSTHIGFKNLVQK